ncbi:MAG: hypothetical protein EB053_01985 [Chlamydiae bacterium]|nr:hypothetical protein [Chlamydiota bacterium]
MKKPPIAMGVFCPDSKININIFYCFLVPLKNNLIFFLILRDLLPIKTKYVIIAPRNLQRQLD